MDLNINDNVFVLDEDFSGRIVKLIGNIVTIETEAGFELEFSKNELVKIESNTNLNFEAFAETSVIDVIAQKENDNRKKISIVKKNKERFEPTMEVDLHIHQLTKKFKGMSNHDMLNLQLDTARHKLEFAMQKRIQKIVFIHGVGEGILKIELEYLFSRYNNVKFYDANYQKYGIGATEVYIFQSIKPNA